MISIRGSIEHRDSFFCLSNNLQLLCEDNIYCSRRIDESMDSVMNRLRSVVQAVVNTKRAYMNPYEHFGRVNIFRAAVASYVAIYFAFRWNQRRKATALRAEKIREKKNVANDALARAHII
uniref:Uncharacterized protein n=1 Tax=Parascaris univalens TaxID=6257 RepID=A0A915ALM4_PARUN